ncbi:hypothetical protein ACROYT_G036833 [Oculina patagonica]
MAETETHGPTSNCTRLLSSNFELKPVDVFKQAVPKLVPFFKTFCIYFILWLPEAENPSILAAIIKILPILSLCGFVVMQGVSLSVNHDYNRRILLGLIFSMFGDIFIVWEHSHFSFGVVAFGVAHLLYATAFGFEPINPIVFLGLVIPSIHTYTLYLPNLEGFLVGAIAGYMLIITIMIWRAITGLQVSVRGKAWQWTKLCACVGSVSFGISDLILGLNKFYLPIPFARAIVMVTYYGAQLGIALSSFTVTQVKIQKAKE